MPCPHACTGSGSAPTNNASDGDRTYSATDTDLIIADSPPPGLAPRKATTTTVTTSSDSLRTADDARTALPLITSTATKVVTITAQPPQPSTFVTNTVVSTATATIYLTTVAGTGSDPTTTATASPSTDTSHHGNMDRGETIGLAVGLSVLAALLVLGGKGVYKYLVGALRARKPKAQSPLIFWDRSPRRNGGGPSSNDTTVSSRPRSAETMRREHLKATIRHLGPQELLAHERQGLEAQRSSSGVGERGDAYAPQQGGCHVESSARLLTAEPRPAANMGSSGPSWFESIPSYYTQSRRSPRP